MTRLTSIQLLLSAVLLTLPVAILYTSWDHDLAWDKYLALLSVFIAVSILAVISRKMSLHLNSLSCEKLAVAIWIPFGALSCYSLSVYAELGNVLAAGIIGTAASFLPDFNKQSDYLKKLPPAIYCGAFVGMSSSVILSSLGLVSLAGIMAGVFYVFTKSVFVGMGGKLGTMAFGGVVFVSLFIWLFP